MLLKLFTVGSIDFSYRVSSTTVQLHSSLLLNTGKTYEGHYFICQWITTRRMFIQIRLVIFIITEIQRLYTTKHNTIMPYNNVLHVSIHQNHHQGTFITKVQKHKFIRSMQILNEISLIYN